MEPISFEKMIEEYEQALWEQDKCIAQVMSRPSSARNRQLLGVLRAGRVDILDAISMMRGR